MSQASMCIKNSRQIVAQFLLVDCSFNTSNLQLNTLNEGVFCIQKLSKRCFLYLTKKLRNKDPFSVTYTCRSTWSMCVLFVCQVLSLHFKLAWRTPSPHSVTWHQEQQAGSQGHFLYPTTSLSSSDPPPPHTHTQTLLPHSWKRELPPN